MSKLNSTIVEFNLRDRRYTPLSFTDFELDTQDVDKIYWIHIDTQQHVSLEETVKKLKIPDELIEFCLENETIPQLIDKDNSITIRIQCPQTTEIIVGNEVEYTNLIIHLTEKYCLTIAEPLPLLASFSKLYPKSLQYAQTPGFILFLILDNVFNTYTKLLFELDLIAEEEELYTISTHEEIYNEVLDTKSNVMKLKRHLLATRDILMRISGKKITVISDPCRASLQELLNRSHMLMMEADAVRDIINTALDKMDNSLMQKLNESMRILSAFAAIFLPMTLIASIYGMNFHFIPELNWKYGYFWALGLMIICGATLYLYFRHKKWF